MVFYVRDPGAGFRRESLDHAATANPNEDPAAHIARREEEGIRAGGYGMLLAAETVDELIYSEIGNEVLLIVVDSAPADDGAETHAEAQILTVSQSAFNCPHLRPYKPVSCLAVAWVLLAARHQACFMSGS